MTKNAKFNSKKSSITQFIENLLVSVDKAKDAKVNSISDNNINKIVKKLLFCKKLNVFIGLSVKSTL